jgi:DNA-binding CsgD family transcriptional regulator
MGHTYTRQTVKYGELVGRERELERVRSFLARAAADGDAMLLSGEPGVGKTVLLDTAAEEASAAGARLLRAAGAEFGADVAFAGLNQLLPPLREGVGQLGAAHRRAISAVLGIGDEAAGVRLTVFTAVLELLCRAAVDRPLLVVVDDLQWLDRSSAVVLGFVARRLTGTRIGLIAASRTAGESFLDRGGLPENEVRPLQDKEASDLLGAYFPMLAPQVHRRVLAEAQGNPLALLELPSVISTSQCAARAPLNVTACRETRWRAVRDGRGDGAVASATAALINLCLDDVLTGRWDEAQQLVDEGCALCALHGYRLLEWPLWYAEAVLAAWRGHVDRAWELTDRMMRCANPREAELVRSYARYVRAAAALGQGDAEEAYQQAAAISPQGIPAPRVPMALTTAMDLVEASLLTGRRSDAVAHASAMADAGIAALSPRPALVALGSAAMAAPDDVAIGLFEQALAAPGVERWPFDLARVRLAYGERLRRHRVTSAARAQLTAALDAFERLGARPWKKRAARELRALGSEVAAAAGCGADSLTPRERGIAMLAATGLTNKEIGRRLHLSHRTVGAHLYRAFPKLGISSRAALRDALRPQY